jgi:hypothetical protein
MAFMAAALPYVSAAATIGTTIGQASAQEKIADIQARQLRKQAIADEASAVQTAKLERKKAIHLQSRVQALAAASGTEVSSVDVQNTLSDIDEQGEYNALAALYSGYSSAGSKRYAATTAESQGKQAVQGAYASSGATILDLAATKYG